MNKLYLTNILGAPSPTAVIVSDESIDKIKWKKVALNTYNLLKSKKIDFSKMAIINKKIKNEFDFKFIQIKMQNGNIGFESNANCGNSMIAAARVIYNIKDNQQKSIFLTNVDTNLKVQIGKKENDSYDLCFNNLIGKSIDKTKVFEGSEKLIINEDFGNIRVSLIDIVNPYIIVNAKEFGIETEEEFLSLDANETKILEKVKKVRKDIKQKYNYDESSEFPKIAIVLNDKNIVARTVYLGSWHKGLPITAAISIAIASKMENSTIYIPNIKEKDKILTPQGFKKIRVETDEEGVILECNIFDIKSRGKIDTFMYDEIER